MNQNRIDALDAIRGLAILAVIQLHAGQLVGFASPLVARLSLCGKYGVQLFYYVSAISILMVWEKRKHQINRTYDFLVRRFFRIAPLFWLTIPVFPIFLHFSHQPTVWAPDGIGFRHIFLTATFLHGFWPDTINSVVPGGWSIAIEMTFYLLFPFIFSKLKNPSLNLFLAIAIYFLNAWLLSPKIYDLLVSFMGEKNSTLVSEFVYFYFPNQVIVFLLSFHFYQLRLKNDGLNWPQVVFGGFTWVGVAVWGYACGFGDWQSCEFLIVVVSAYMIMKFMIEIKRPWPFLSSLGRLSYAVYLTNVFVVYATGYIYKNYFFNFIAATLICYFIARLSNKWIEEPIRLKVDSFLSRRAKQLTQSQSH